MSSIIDPQWMARLEEKLRAERHAARAEDETQKQKEETLSRGQIISEYPFLRISDFKNIPHDGMIRGRGFYPFRIYKRDNPALLACIEAAKDRPIKPTEIRKRRQQEEFNKRMKEQREREARAPKTLVQQVKGGLWGAYVTPIGQERRLMGVYLTQNEAYIAAGNAVRKIVAGEAF
jgi:hypothetical protein